MLTLRSGVYTESDLKYLITVIEQGESGYYGCEECRYCKCKRACEDLKRLNRHIQKLLNEHSFSEK